MTTRHDPHRPSAIDPADYDYERAILTRVPADLAVDAAMAGEGAIRALHDQQEADRAWVAEHGWQGGNYASSRTCDHCGAYFVYGHAFRYRPTAEVIVVGWICAGETMALNGREALEHKRLVDRVARARGAVKADAALRRRQAEAREVHADLDDLLAVDHRITRDIADRFARTGAISEKQIELLRKLWREEQNPPPCEVCSEEGHKEETCPSRKPWRAGRQDLTVRVLGTKVQESHYGTQYKMLCRDETSGAKLWATVPSSLFDAIAAEIEKGTLTPDSDYGYLWHLRGRRIEIRVTVEPSQDDPYFGFGKRPSGKLLPA